MENKIINAICDAAQDMEYQRALRSNEEEFSKHTWIPDPHGLAQKATDAEFNRIPRAQMVAMDWSIFEK